MPVVAVVAAGAAWALGGGAAVAGVLAGTATLATTLTAVATVGATLGAIGAVTKDKTLSTIGMAMGAVGGIGSLAANAGLFGEAATTESLFGAADAGIAAPDIAADVAATNDLSSLSTLPELPGVGSVTGATAATDAVGSTGQFMANSVLPTEAIGDATKAASGDVSGLINSPAGSGGGASGIKTITSDTVDDATNQLVKGSGGGSIPSGSPTDAASIAKAGAGAPDAPAAPLTGGVPDVKIPGQSYQGADGATYISDGTKFVKQDNFWGSLMKSPATQYGMIQAGGSLVSGLFDPLKPAQVDALNAQAAANRAQTAQQAQQAKNMTGPLPTATRNGLINSPVTGSVAA
jgi:hypothetical protein